MCAEPFCARPVRLEVPLVNPLSCVRLSNQLKRACVGGLCQRVKADPMPARAAAGSAFSPGILTRCQPSPHRVEQSVGTAEAYPAFLMFGFDPTDLTVHDLSLFVDEQAQDQDDV